MSDIEQLDESKIAARRRVLKMGAIGAAAVVSVRPALAQTAGSVLNCQIPVPSPSDGDKYVASDGSLVASGTSGSYKGGWNFAAEDVKKALGGSNLPGVSDSQQSTAYLNYIKKLQSGQTGFTCFASIQMPR